MRILHLVHRSWPFHGGAERYVLEHAMAGNRRGHSSVICTTDAWDMSWLISRSGIHIERRTDVYEGIRIMRFPVLHPPLQDILRGLLRRLGSCGEDRYYYPNPFIPSLYRWLSRDRGFDLVHANAMPFMLFAGWKYGRDHGCRLVSVPHANVGEKHRRVRGMDYFGGCQESILRDSCFVSAQSRFEMGLYREIGVPMERIHLSGSGIDPGEFRDASGDSARRRLGIEGPFLLSLTAHTGQRGLEHMLIAFRAVLESHRDAVLVLAGPVMPDAMDHLQRLVPDDPLLKERVVVTGYVRKEERVDLLAAADAVLLPSRLDCFGIVLLEAWMSGKPVVGCWSGVMPDLIVEGVNGFLVPFGDTVTLAWRMRTLLENGELRRSMGSAGRSMVLGEWTWERITDRFYRRLAHCYAGGMPE